MNLDHPKTFSFRYPVRLDDLDFMNRVGNASWMLILERARVDLLAHLNYPMTRMHAENIGGVVAEANIKYCRAATYGDEAVVELWGTLPTKTGATLRYRVHNTREKLLLEADTRIVFIGADGRSIAMPEELRGKLFPESGDGL